MSHYIHVALNTNFTYGKHKNKLKDSLYTRLRFGTPFYGELGMSVSDDDKKCKLCYHPMSHTLQHYILQCPVLTPFRNPDIAQFTDQVVWMINNNKLEDALRQTNLQYILRL